MHRRFFLLATLLLCIVFPHDIYAARLYLSPSSGTYKAGETITVRVLATSDVSMNAVAAHLSFTSSVLSIQSVSKANSVLTFWVADPLYSQANGTVDMEGVALSGFQGSGGTIATITFKARKAGEATVAFLSGQVLANDGQGTDITSGLGSATFDIDAASTPTPKPDATPSVQPVQDEPVVQDGGELTITSSTHPDQNTWYARKDGVFSWNVTSTVTATRILLDTKKASKPTVLYDGALISKNISDLPQGVSYLHVQLKDGSSWGGTAHFAIRVDTSAPSITQFEELSRADNTDPHVRLYAKAEDATSGIDSFEISIDGKAPAVFDDVSAGLYSLTVPSGLHTLTLTAYDKAHNASTRSISVGVTPLTQPQLTEVPSEVASGETFTIKGTAQPDSKVVIYFIPRKIAGMTPLAALLLNPTPDQFTLEGTVDQNGTFVLSSERTPSADRYQLYAVSSDERGASSLPSEPKTLSVSRPGYIVVGEYVISLLSLIAPLVALLALLVVSMLWLVTYIRRFRRALLEEVEDVDRVLSKAMALLKDDITDRLGELKKKTTSKELRVAEEKMLGVIEEELKDTEKYIRKEVRDVKKLLASKRVGPAPVKIEIKEGK